MAFHRAKKQQKKDRAHTLVVCTDMFTPGLYKNKTVNLAAMCLFNSSEENKMRPPLNRICFKSEQSIELFGGADAGKNLGGKNRRLW